MRSTLPKEPQKNLSSEDVQMPYPTQLTYLPSFFLTILITQVQGIKTSLFFVVYTYTTLVTWGKELQHSIILLLAKQEHVSHLPIWATQSPQTPECLVNHSKCACPYGLSAEESDSWVFSRHLHTPWFTQFQKKVQKKLLAFKITYWKAEKSK